MGHIARDACAPQDHSVRWAALIVALATIIAYHNSLKVPFLLDDEISILDNESIRDLRNLRSVLAPREEVFTAGRPLLNATFALNYATGAYSVVGYHVVNIVIHVLSALTLFGIVRRTLKLPLLQMRFSATSAQLALCASLLWALHPLHTSSVTYVSQRAESLMGFFYLFTLYGFLRTLDRRGSFWTAVCIASCAAGMLVKEVMVTAPLLVLLFDRAFVAGSFQTAWRQRPKLYLGLAAAWVLLGATMFATQLHRRGVGFVFNYSSDQYVKIECEAVCHYLRLSVWPHPLVFDFGEQISIPSVTTVVLCALFLGLLIIATVIVSLKRPVVGFFGCWFFIILSPTSTFIPVAGQPIAENRMYLPLAALTVGFTVVTWHLAGSRALKILTGAAALLAIATLARNHDYRSELTIWADTTSKRPGSSRAHFYHGTAQLRSGNVARAAESLQHSLRIDPNYSSAHINLACLLLGQNKVPEAIHHFQQALLLKGDDPLGHTNFGAALFQAGRREEALMQFKEALRLRPRFIPALVSLGITLRHFDRNTEARAAFEELLQVEPANQIAITNLAELRNLPTGTSESSKN